MLSADLHQHQRTSCRSSHYICCWYPTLGVSKSVQRDCKINVDLRSEEVILTGLWLLEESWVGQLIGTVEPAIKSLILTHKNNKSTVYICVHTIQECKAVHNAVILEHMMRHLVILIRNLKVPESRAPGWTASWWGWGGGERTSGRPASEGDAVHAGTLRSSGGLQAFEEPGLLWAESSPAIPSARRRVCVVFTWL